MMEIEKTNTEKMLREFWLIHRHFTEHPELLMDDNVSKVYDNLMSIRDVDGLKDWLRLKERIDTQSNEAVRYEDVLGRMYDLAIHAEQAELLWAADGMARLADNGFHDTLTEDIPILERQRQQLVGDLHDAVVIFRQGNGNFAYGQDADRLFELVGWQTSGAKVGDEWVSWMPVSDMGIQALAEAEVPYYNPQPNVSVIRVEDVPQQVIDDESLSLAQQSVDYFRQLNTKPDAIVSLGVFPVMIQRDAYVDVLSAQFIHFHDKNVELVMANGEKNKMVDNNTWIVWDDDKDYMLTVGEQLAKARNEAEMQIRCYDSTRMQRQMLTDDILDEYARMKKNHPNETLIIRQEGFAEAFGDDAVRIAQAANAHLWQRETNYCRTVSMVMLTPFQIDRAEATIENIHIADSELKEKQEDLALKSSPLNEVLHAKQMFDDGGVMKKRSGEYVVWAKLDGQDLPEKVISPYLGVQYSRLSDGPEKDAKLKLILQQCYEDALFKHEGQKLSQSVRIA